MEDKNRRIKKSIMTFILILAIVMVLGAAGKLTEVNINISGSTAGAEDVYEKHIAVLYIEGTISQGDDIYNHGYALDAIDGMIENNKNRGLLLYIDTPGGGVYESDELYLKIKEYKEMTGRPVYSYMANQATSGGYYIAAHSDKILANRNCWTGSIGVTMGNFYDISGLLTKYGIDVTTITSGRNKAMGDITAPLTDEQKQILQSLVDEAYDQFVGIVAEGRNLDEAYVRTVADGRLYTAQQARELDLIDEVVATYSDAAAIMIQEEGLGDCEFYDFMYEPEYSILNNLILSIEKLAKSEEGGSDVAALTKLMEKTNEMAPQYMCEVIK